MVGEIFVPEFNQFSELGDDSNEDGDVMDFGLYRRRWTGKRLTSFQ